MSAVCDPNSACALRLGSVKHRAAPPVQDIALLKAYPGLTPPQVTFPYTRITQGHVPRQGVDNVNISSTFLYLCCTEATTKSFFTTLSQHPSRTPLAANSHASARNPRQHAQGTPRASSGGSPSATTSTTRARGSRRSSRLKCEHWGTFC